MKIEVRTLKQMSVISNKELYYIAIGEAPDTVFINVGQKTYSGVFSLIENNKTPEQPQPTPKLPDNPTPGKKGGK